MIRGRSPPKHRHDGTSPLPMGIDWSPPPKIWNGRDTVWPHDPRTGWSYCVTIPSWVALPKSRSSASDPVVFYRVQVGIQSPEGITTTRRVLRRFNDFLKLFSDLKKAFPKKTLPSAPPKGLLRMKSRALLEERRYSLEEWMSNLLSDIDISRSTAVASFLELEAAARASFQESTQPSDANPSTNNNISSHRVHPTLTTSSSIASDYGSDTVYETSELGSPSLGRDDGFEAGLEEMALDDGFASPMENQIKYGMSNIEEGLLMGESILDQLEGFKKDKLHTRHVTDDGRASKAVSSLTADGVSRVEGKLVDHTRKPSNESLGSDLSSFRGSEMSNLWNPNLPSEGSLDITNGVEVLRTMGSPGRPELQSLSSGQIILPRHHQPKLDRILMIMQRRLVTAKTDMEDLITRLNQEIAVKEFLDTKVKDLEVELESTKEKSKETLQQAVSLEKDRFTKMQWDMEELQRKSLEMELKLKSQEDSKVPTGSTSLSTFSGKEELLKELEATKGHLDNLRKQHEELEVKAKSDVRILVKEVKSLRRSQNELKEKLEESFQSKSLVERQLQQEIECNEQAMAVRKKLLHDCQTLQILLQLCNIKLADDNFVADSCSISKVLDLLSDSDKQVDLILVKTHGLAPDAESCSNNNDVDMVDHDLRLVLKDIICISAKLRKQVNIFIRSAFQTDTEDNNDAPSKETLLKQVLETQN